MIDRLAGVVALLSLFVFLGVLVVRVPELDLLVVLILCALLATVDFALALFVGMAAGTYSSIMIAGPLLAVWPEGEDEWTTQREELHRIRALRAGKVTEPAAAAPQRPPKSEPVITNQPADTPPGSGPAPRPPKKGRR